MYQLLAKKGQLFAIILGGGVTLIYLATVLSGLSAKGYSTSDDLVQVLKNSDEQFNFFDLGLKMTIGLIVLALIIAVGFGIWQLLTNIKGSLKIIIALAVIIAIFFALYSSSDTDRAGILGPTLEEFNITDNISKLISGGLKTTLLLAGGAVVSMVLLEIYNIFK